MIVIFIYVDQIYEDDWDAAQIKITRLQAQEKIFYYQPYAPTDEVPPKKPFVIVIQYEFIQNSAQRFSATNFWALNFTFKTNRYGLPLYVSIVPNENGIGIPVFYML